MLETIIVILFILWLVGAFGYRGRLRGGWGGTNLVHVLLVLAVILLLFRLLR
jgi:hypothetical protein